MLDNIFRCIVRAIGNLLTIRRKTDQRLSNTTSCSPARWLTISVALSHDNRDHEYLDGSNVVQRYFALK